MNARSSSPTPPSPPPQLLLPHISTPLTSWPTSTPSSFVSPSPWPPSPPPPAPRVSVSVATVSTSIGTSPPNCGSAYLDVSGTTPIDQSTVLKFREVLGECLQHSTIGVMIL
ncbi:hypothetical protein PVAP13_8KG201700 [Panicum virgatum]|uniref:Uncharacterized protein n=1 Tax=Panicum virgatum TaxID=38727 RepID=A0A8T0PID3_PANVG|nr:hypothetical protein PVAP13_8KG201700 [Panicum virgatum]